jgi:hypothetical protein
LIFGRIGSDGTATGPSSAFVAGSLCYDAFQKAVAKPTQSTWITQMQVIEIAFVVSYNARISIDAVT